jgi:chemotaxis protein histidine kinase CheA
MKLLRLTGLLCAAALVSSAETPRDVFNRGAERFTRSQDAVAKQIVDAGLQQYPDDAALLALKALLEQKQQQSSGAQQDQQDQSADSQDSSERKQEQQEQNPQEQKPEQEPSAEDSDRGRSQEKSAGEASEDQPHEAREMTKEEAALLLDAMKQQEQALRRKVALDRMRSNMDQLPPVDKDW